MTALRRAPWYVVPLMVFISCRALSTVLILILARHQIPASALPTGMPLPTLVDPPSYFHVIANWDGQWYRQIAIHGYPSDLPTRNGVVQQNAWAFYPLFPTVVRLLMVIGVSFGVVASVTSLTCAAVAMCLVYRMLYPEAGRFTATLTVLALSSAPAAPIFQTAYTEGLALLLLVIALWGLHTRRYLVFAVAGLGLSLTRAIVLPLAVVAGWEYLRLRQEVSLDKTRRLRLLYGGLLVALSSLIWPAVVARATGHSDAYWSTQKSWATVARGHAGSWLVSRPDNPVPTAVAFVTLVLLATICWRARSWPQVMRVWPVPYALFILAVTPATASVFRFSLLLVAPMWPAPEWSRRLTSPVGRTAVGLSVLTLGLVLQWWWLRSYFVIDPWSRGHP